MKKFGFFNEFHGEGDPLPPSMNPPYAWQSQVASYLDSGRLVWLIPELVEDPYLLGEPVGPRLVRTDGEWIWPGELAHLVRRHGVTVPDEFLAQMRSRNWQSSTVSDESVELAATVAPPA